MPLNPSLPDAARTPNALSRRLRRRLVHPTGVIAIGALLVAGLGTATAATMPAGHDTSITSFVAHSGSQLTVDGKPFRFAGANIYWLGLDDNIQDASGQPTYPTQFRIDNALSSAQAMGVTVVRSHTLGISVGNPKSIEPTLGTFNDAAFDTIDYAVADASRRGIYLDIPLIDEWRFYHGGKSVFTGWRGYPNDPDTSQNAGNNPTQQASEAHFYTDPVVIGDFETYIAHVLDHVNPITGLALKDSPNIMSWETGNELFDAPPAWTDEIARFIKSIAPRQLVSDGSAATGAHVADHGLQSPAVDIVGGHFYPRDPAWMHADAAAAAAAGKAYVVGEYAWTGAGTDGSSLAAWLGGIAADPNISGAAFWSLLPQEESGADEPHGDGYAVWSPGTTPLMQAALQLFNTFARSMKLTALLAGTTDLVGGTTPSPAAPSAVAAGAPALLPPGAPVGTPAAAPVSTPPSPQPVPSLSLTAPQPTPVQPSPVRSSVTSSPVRPLPSLPGLTPPTLLPVGPGLASGTASATPAGGAPAPSFGPLDSTSWQSWAGAGGLAQSASDALRLKTGSDPGGDDRLTVMSSNAPRHDGTVAADLTCLTGTGQLAVVVDASSSGPSMGTDDALVATVDAAAGTVTLARTGNSPLQLSPTLAIPGFAVGSPVHVTVRFAGTAVQLTATTSTGSVSWSGTETTLTGNGNTGFVLDGAQSGATVTGIAYSS